VAALAMVLQYWEHPIPHDEIAAALEARELKGVRGSRLAAFARARGFQAFAYAGDVPHVKDSLGKGRPLIVAWRVGRDDYHDVVVVGFDEERAEVVVNDPAEGANRRLDVARFEERWAAAGHWTLLVLPAAP
jgi:ABC-type bacteriocin/lantibiotic exporter with double-glycine peptidase domain